MRSIPSINTYKPEQILRKDPFLLPIPVMNPGMTTPRTTEPVSGIVNPGPILYETKSQADFIREFHPGSHDINSVKYYPNQLFFDNKKRVQAKVHTRIAVAYQQMIHTKRKTALIGNNVGMRLIGNRNKQAGEEALAYIREGWEESNMEIAIDRCIDSDFMTGDCAVYIFLSNFEVGYRVFSYADGDTLYPHYHPITGEIALLGRKYTQENEQGTKEEYLDVIDEKYFMTYHLNREKNDGEWEVEMEATPHGFNICPVAYHRSRFGPVWTPSQSLIDNYELGISQFSENNLSYGLRILYTMGAEFEVMSNPDGTPSRIDSPDPNAKVGYLENAEGADGAFAKQLEILNKNIMRCSFAVETPEIKSGADMSSLTVKMLFADSYLKALADSQEYQPFLDRVMKLFKYAYGICAELTDKIGTVKVKPYLEPFVFMSETEVVNALVQLTAAGVLSKQTATEIAYNSGYGTASEWDRILQEAHDELVAEQQSAKQAAKNNPVAASRAQA